MEPSTGSPSSSGKLLCSERLHNQGPNGNWDEQIVATERHDGTGIDLDVSYFDNKGGADQVPIARAFVTLPHEGMKTLIESYGQMAGASSTS